MTREEVIAYIKEWRKDKYALNGADREVLDMAIEALQFVDEYHKRNIEAYAHDMGVSLEQAELELRVDLSEI